MYINKPLNVDSKAASPRQGHYLFPFPDDGWVSASRSVKPLIHSAGRHQQKQRIFKGLSSDTFRQSMPTDGIGTDKGEGEDEAGEEEEQERAK